jgi:endonuclease/exonuclease/phosphatase family metal-dependent hydrolase
MPELRILTLNTGKCDGPYRARLGWLADELARLEPDIIACQEAFVAEDGSLDTARILARQLGMHVIAARIRHKVRRCEAQSVAGWSGPALLGRQPWTASDVLPLPDDQRDGERAALIGQANYQGHAMTVASVHLTHLPDADGLRGQQLNAVLQHPMLARASGSAPIRNESKGPVRLICGDFNTTPDGPVLGPLLASGTVADAYVLGSGAVPRGTLAPPFGPTWPVRDRCIDLIQYLPDECNTRPRSRHACVVLSHPHPRIGFYPSDHFGVMVTLVLGG